MLENKVSDLTIDELRMIIHDVVTQTLTEMLADPDEGLALQDGLEKALQRSIKSVREGAPVFDASEVANNLNLDW